MNRQERRSISKDKQRIDVSAITVHFRDGSEANLNTSMVQVIDKYTGRSLFDEVLEPAQTPLEIINNHDITDKQSYAVEFDTPEGVMIFSKDGDWSGVKKK